MTSLVWVRQESETIHFLRPLLDQSPLGSVESQEKPWNVPATLGQRADPESLRGPLSVPPLSLSPFPLPAAREGCLSPSRAPIFFKAISSRALGLGRPP